MRRQSRVRPWHVILLSVAAGLGFWCLDSIYNFYFFRQHLRFMLFDPPDSALDTLFANATPYTLLVRLSLLNLCLIGGLLGAAYISQRQRAERNLRQERDYSAGIIAGSPIIIFGATPDGQITFLNQEAERALGLAARAGIEQPWWHVFADQETEAAARTHFQALAQGALRDYHTPVRTADGQSKTIAWSAIRRVGRSDAREEIIGFGRDITQSQQAELRLRHRLAVEEALAAVSGRFLSAGRVDMAGVLRLLADVMDASRCYVFRIDSDGRICNLSEATDRRTPPRRHHPQEMLESQLPHLLPRLRANEDVVVEDVTRLPESLRAAREAMQAHGVCALAIVPIRAADGQLMGFLGLDDTQQTRSWQPEDVSSMRLAASMIGAYWERRAAEELLLEERTSLAERVTERTQALQAANIELARAGRLKDEFMAAMSHELRTPLNAILGLSEALQENVYGPLTEKQRQSLATIERSGQHLLELINDVLDVAKIGAGKMVLEMGPVSVPTVCEACLRLVRRDAARKDLYVSAELDETVTHMQADERRLKQMLLNLLSNAVKFTPEGGTIGLVVTGSRRHRQIHFTVWDTGIGIAEDDMARLFEPFMQVDSSLSRQYQGSGLGLALVHQMAQLHGGSVAVESQLGEGSRFSVSLPWREDA